MDTTCLAMTLSQKYNTKNFPMPTPTKDYKFLIQLIYLYLLLLQKTDNMQKFCFPSVCWPGLALLTSFRGVSHSTVSHHASEAWQCTCCTIMHRFQIFFTPTTIKLKASATNGLKLDLVTIGTSQILGSWLRIMTWGLHLSWFRHWGSGEVLENPIGTLTITQNLRWLVIIVTALGLNLDFLILH